VNITLPATQTYVENSIHEFPMYAESSNNTLNFKNLCGALKLHQMKIKDPSLGRKLSRRQG
jgi:hypothetical protein